MNAPIAVFAYRRPAHLAAMLESLSQCLGFAQSPVIVFVDGPKGEEDVADVLAVRSLLEGLKWSNLEIVAARENQGLKRSVCAGVSAVAAAYERVIVLEDDLVLSPLALHYFNTALDRYADESSVWSISGYVYDVPDLRQRQEAFFLPFAQSWGWATWNRAWSQFDMDAEVPVHLLDSASFRKAFSMNGLSDYATMLALARDGLIDSWFILWYLAIFRKGGLSLFPPVPYVANRGVSGRGGTHAGRWNPYDLLVKPAFLGSAMVGMPDRVAVDYPAMDAIPRSWEASVIRTIHLAGAIKRRMRRRLARG